MPDKSVQWSDRALIEITNLTDYLLGEWGIELTSRVLERLDTAVQRIISSPEHFPVTIKSKKVRRCVISPQTSIFFKVDKRKIIIISVFDNRQDPKKRKL